MLKRLIAVLMLTVTLVCCQTVLAEGLTASSRWSSKPTTEELQEEARILGEEVIGGTAEIIHTGNFRSDASEYSAKAGVAIEGEVYEIIGYYLNSSGRSWIQIDWDGREVWVSASLVRCSVSSALDARYVSTRDLIGTQIRIIAGCARARSGAGTEYYTVGYVYRNESYEVLSARASDTNKIWYQIRVDGRLGWISSGIAENSSYFGGTDTVTSATTSSGSYSGGTDTVTSASSATTSSGGSQAYPAGERCTVIAESARARSGAGTEYAVIAYVYRGERYTILSVDNASNGRQWYQVNVDGVNCWISSGVTELK